MIKLTMSRVVNIILLIILIFLSIIIFKTCNDISKIDGIEKAVEAYINFSSITIGFFATVISMLTVLLKQKFFNKVIDKKTAKHDFILIGILTILFGFISLILAVIISFIIANGTINYYISNSICVIFLSTATIYIVNLALFLLVTLFSIFSDIE